jgi:hypothetical protein
MCVDSKFLGADSSKFGEANWQLTASVNKQEHVRSFGELSAGVASVSVIFNLY